MTEYDEGASTSSQGAGRSGEYSTATALPHTHAAMSIELPKEAHQQAIASIERYFQDEHSERIGNIAAAALLKFFLQEIGPSVYNQAVATVQDRLQQRIMELDIEVHEDEFGYWRQAERGRKGK